MMLITNFLQKRLNTIHKFPTNSFKVDANMSNLKLWNFCKEAVGNTVSEHTHVQNKTLAKFTAKTNVSEKCNMILAHIG